MSKFILTFEQFGFTAFVTAAIWVFQFMISDSIEATSAVYTGPCVAHVEGKGDETRLKTTWEGEEYTTSDDSLILFFYQHQDEELVFTLSEQETIINVVLKEEEKEE